MRSIVMCHLVLSALKYVSLFPGKRFAVWMNPVHKKNCVGDLNASGGGSSIRM